MDDLFPEPIPARKNDPETSKEAARRIALKRTELQMITLRKYGDQAELSDLDLQNIFNNHGSTYRTRANELTGLKLLRVVRIVKQRGAPRQVRVITPLGLEVLLARP